MSPEAIKMIAAFTPESQGLTVEGFYKELEIILKQTTKHLARVNPGINKAPVQICILKIAWVLQQQPAMLKRLAALDAKN